MEELRINGAAHRTVNVAIGESLQQRQRAWAAHVDFSKGRQVEQAGALAGGLVFLTHKLKEWRANPTPVALVFAGAPPGFSRLEVIHALPTVFLTKNRALFLQA